ncbi:putative thymidylate kinase protein [Halorhabdus tiamatea SARL4B]|uniref:Probable thymidylate kinase n=1 Tax=Halorhabdus tiamatea SARL4B TaxID=1033806 RepID=F7PIV6_9EURY|nr:dTMP kinase [Halorhabdus tiamatea]ERJ05447.1 putative thymidylate kinase protein [Halorhabdus tiamatea SARL4B]CCQ33327.1 thymidylate kinase [Halorhabdus tiamatea SARL4B]
MLITLEGIDGSGKSSAWEFLQGHAADLDPEFTFTREPTESWYGEAVRRSIQEDDADSLAELFLYTADHAAHLANTVQPALDRGEVVISDRYSDSRYAYQGATLADRLDDPLAFVREIHEPWTRPPDATIYLDVDAETGAERSGGTNKFERIEQLRAVRENYERLIDDDPERFVRIDATRAAEAVRADVLEAVETLLDEQ